MTQPRLLMVLNDAPFFITHRLPIAIAARDAGFEVHIAVPHDDAPVAIMRREGFQLHDIPLKRGARRIGGEIVLIAALWRIVGTVRPDILHAVTMKPVLYAGLVARLRRVPAVVHAITGLGYLFLIDGLAARLQRALVKRLYRYALGHRNAVAIFQNPDDLQLFVDNGLVDPAITVMIRGCGVDMHGFAQQPEPAGEPVVVFPARILGDKGVHEFIAAARDLTDRARFVLVGRTDPDNPTDVGEAGIRAWAQEGIVTWQGFSDDMPSALAQASVVCMPSYREGLPRVLIEAAAIGRAIVTTDVPGCREIVRDGDNGLLVPARDGAATAAAVQRLLDDPDLRARMAARSRVIAETEFSVDLFIRQSLDAYRQVSPTTFRAAAAENTGSGPPPAI
ncbi:MAG: glycosyltransferase family 4 protein [Proteobacteria bacterium]|nr:glycosyltransferase family 4 protein [Pseudomonadota bacterium]MDA1059054.1 glycosyltransferase family 4 protein [Pseudomonadota bacterium]